jgi:hypothetical protein
VKRPGKTAALALFALLVRLQSVLAAPAAPSQPISVHCPPDGARLELRTETAAEPDLRVRLFQSGPAGPFLLGSTERDPHRLIFVPALPFVSGQHYLAEWSDRSGQRQTVEFQLPASSPSTPTVRMLPSGVELPANALKFYLEFSEPMEQGVFLERLRLAIRGGQEVMGPFRETELWSPDGKRLTVWFHPGRQKTGVNLNLEEGPVLLPGQTYTLAVSSQWRSAAGVPLGRECVFEFRTTAADHDCPALEQWRLRIPQSGTRQPLAAVLEEAVDPVVLRSALRVTQGQDHLALAGSIDINADGRGWRFVPGQPWSPGPHKVWVDPALEDLAGNSLAKPFEVDATQVPHQPPVAEIPFSPRSPSP